MFAFCSNPEVRSVLEYCNSNCPTSFKLQVFDTVVRTKLVDGLESVMLLTNHVAKETRRASIERIEEDSRSNKQVHRLEKHKRAVFWGNTTNRNKHPANSHKNIIKLFSEYAHYVLHEINY